jgi:ADP-ribose pyrophosphatase YjhB (NUDIX family)
MPTVDCLIVKDGKVLMLPSGGGEGASETLVPVRGRVQGGEYPLQACARLVKEKTSLHVNPSCVGVVVDESEGHSGEYCLAFVAELSPAEDPSAATREGFRWLPFGQVGQAEGVAVLDREVIPALLTSDRPLEVVLTLDETGPALRRRVLNILPVDPARLSPLVFAVTT